VKSIWCLESASAQKLAVGDALLGVPWHVCPTVALHAEAVLIERGTVTASAALTRAREKSPYDVIGLVAHRTDAGGSGRAGRLVTWARLNAFLALLAAALLVGVGAGQPMLGVAKAFQEGMGSTLGGVAAVICLGTMLGKLLAESRGAEVLATRFAEFFGPRRIGWCIMALALVVGLTTWFAVGLILLDADSSHADARDETALSSSGAAAAGLSLVMHGLMPPHPGPVMAINALHANQGKVLLWGFASWEFRWRSWPALFSPVWRDKRLHINADTVAAPAAHPGTHKPDFGLTLFSMLLPVG
jgi:gluconate:H+ symporter, GntP family